MRSFYLLKERIYFLAWNMKLLLSFLFLQLQSFKTLRPLSDIKNPHVITVWVIRLWGHWMEKMCNVKTLVWIHLCSIFICLWSYIRLTVCVCASRPAKRYEKSLFHRDAHGFLQVFLQAVSWQSTPCSSVRIWCSSQKPCEKLGMVACMYL